MSKEYEEKYYELKLMLKNIIEDNHNENYKKKYYDLLKKINKTNHSICYDRCPPIKSCCGACNMLKKIINQEKDERYKRDLKPINGLHADK